MLIIIVNIIVCYLFVSDVSSPEFNYPDVKVSLSPSDILQWTQKGYYTDFLVSYTKTFHITNSMFDEPPLYFVTNETFVRLEDLRIHIGGLYRISVTTRENGRSRKSIAIYLTGMVSLSC